MTSLISKLDSKTKDVKGRGLIAFKKHLDDIGEAIEANYPQIEIWRMLHDSGDMPISYEMFSRYCNRFFPKSEGIEPKTVTTKSTPVKKPKASPPKQIKEETKPKPEANKTLDETVRIPNASQVNDDDLF